MKVFNNFASGSVRYFLSRRKNITMSFMKKPMLNTNNITNSTMLIIEYSGNNLIKIAISSSNVGKLYDKNIVFANTLYNEILKAMTAVNLADTENAIDIKLFLLLKKLIKKGTVIPANAIKKKLIGVIENALTSTYANGHNTKLPISAPKIRATTA